MALTETQVTEEEKTLWKKRAKRMTFSGAIEEFMIDRGGSITIVELRQLSERGDDVIRNHCSEMIKFKIAEWRNEGELLVLL